MRCESCGRKFNKSDYMEGKQVYCSRKCAKKAQVHHKRPKNSGQGGIYYNEGFEIDYSVIPEKDSKR